MFFAIQTNSTPIWANTFWFHNLTTESFNGRANQFMWREGSLGMEKSIGSWAPERWWLVFGPDKIQLWGLSQWFGLIYLYTYLSPTEGQPLRETMRLGKNLRGAKLLYAKEKVSIPFDLDLYARMINTSRVCYSHWYSCSVVSENCDNKPNFPSLQGWI